MYNKNSNTLFGNIFIASIPVEVNISKWKFIDLGQIHSIHKFSLVFATQLYCYSNNKKPFF